MRCVITDYMGDDTMWEEAELRSAEIDSFVSPTKRSGDWIAEARDADAIITRHARIGSSEIEQLTKCRIIARYGVGYDNIDVASARRAGIVVTNVPAFCAPEVAEHVIALIMAIERALMMFAPLIRSGGWQPDPLPAIRPIEGLRLGVVGAGRIGREVAQRAAGLGMVVHAYDPFVDIPASMIGHESVKDLAGEVDALSLHVPLLDGTRGMVDAELLSHLQPGSTLINCGRGGLCDEEAVLAALDDGTLRGVGFDTFASEPLVSDSRLRYHPRVICTPHVAYMSSRSLVEAKKGCVQEVIRACSGLPPVNPVMAG